jgi:hypothetical protein
VSLPVAHLCNLSADSPMPSQQAYSRSDFLFRASIHDVPRSGWFMCDASANLAVCSEENSEETSHMRRFPLPRFLGGLIVFSMFCMAGYGLSHKIASAGSPPLKAGRQYSVKAGLHPRP